MLMVKARVAVSPGIGFGQYGDDHVRFRFESKTPIASIRRSGYKNKYLTFTDTAQAHGKRQPGPANGFAVNRAP